MIRKEGETDRELGARIQAQAIHRESFVWIDCIALWFGYFRAWQAEGPISGYSTEEWCLHLEELARFTDELDLPMRRIHEVANVEIQPGLGNDIKTLMVAYAAEGSAKSKFGDMAPPSRPDEVTITGLMKALEVGSSPGGPLMVEDLAALDWEEFNAPEKEP